jgi:hypothetical protein
MVPSFKSSPHQSAICSGKRCGTATALKAGPVCRGQASVAATRRALRERRQGPQGPCGISGPHTFERDAPPLGLRNSKWAIPDEGVLALAFWNSQVRFSKIQIVEIRTDSPDSSVPSP